MEKVSSTSTALAGSRAELIQKLLEQSEQQALKEAGEKKMKVNAVADLQRKKVMELVNSQGSDGDAAMGEDMSILTDIKNDIDKGLQKSDQDRRKSVAPAPDAYVLPEDSGEMVGLQHDGTREIGIAGRALKDDRVAKHEAAHRKQEGGAPVAKIPKTGDSVIDAKGGQISRIGQREWDSVRAEGGLKNHTPEYFDHVETTNRIAKYLNENGEAGDALVQKAAMTNDGFREMTEAIQIAAIRKQLKEGTGVSEFSLN